MGMTFHVPVNFIHEGEFMSHCYSYQVDQRSFVVVQDAEVMFTRKVFISTLLSMCPHFSVCAPELEFDLHEKKTTNKQKQTNQSLCLIAVVVNRLSNFLDSLPILHVQT